MNNIIMYNIFSFHVHDRILNTQQTLSKTLMIYKQQHNTTIKQCNTLQWNNYNPDQIIPLFAFFWQPSPASVDRIKLTQWQGDQTDLLRQ